MGADAALVQGAFNAYAAPQVNPADAWIEFGKNIGEITAKSITAIAEKKREQKLKTDTEYARLINAQNKNIQGPLQDSYGIVVDDMDFQADIYTTISDNKKEAASLQIQNQQAQQDSASISETLKLHDKILNSEEYEGAVLSNSVVTGDFMEQWANPTLSARYTFTNGLGETKVIVSGNPEDAKWLEENKESILDGDWKQTELRYGLINKTQVIQDVVDDREFIPNTGEVVIGEDGEANFMIRNDKFGEVIGQETVDVYNWVSAEDIKSHLNTSLEDVGTKGELLDLASTYRDKGESWYRSDPGRLRVEEGKPDEMVRYDQREELNELLLRQDVQTLLKDKKPHQIRSMIVDPVVGNRSLVENLQDALLAELKDGTDDIKLDNALAGLKVQVPDGEGNMVDGNEYVFGMEGEGGPGVDTKAEIINMINTIAAYKIDGENKMSDQVRKAVDKIVEEYYFTWTKDQFILGTNNTYRPGGGIGQYGEEEIDTSPLFTYL